MFKILLAVVIAFHLSFFLFPSIQSNVSSNTKCALAYNCTYNSDDTMNCFYSNEENEEESIVCNIP